MEAGVVMLTRTLEVDQIDKTGEDYLGTFLRYSHQVDKLVRSTWVPSCEIAIVYRNP